MFGFLKGKKENALPPEMEKIFARLKTYLEDEAAQNMRLPEALRGAIESGEDADITKGNTAEQFGRRWDNPIPVNGPLGEILYLSSLQTLNETPILFHRLGNLNNIDVYEIVTADSKNWDVLFLDMYHPRKSRMAPKGYQLLKFVAVFTGANSRVENFPYDLQNAISNCTQRMIGIPLPHPRIRMMIESHRYSRVPAQEALIESLLSNGLQLCKSD